MLFLRGGYNDDIVQIGEGERLHVRTNHAVQGTLVALAECSPKGMTFHWYRPLPGTVKAVN